MVTLMVEMIEPFFGGIYDPCCGTGGFYVQSIRFVLAHSGRVDDIAVYGQERNPETYRLARMNLAIRGISGELLFLDARKLGHMVNRTQKDLAPEDIAKLADTYHAWREGRDYEDVSGFCKSAGLEEVRAHGHVLTPGRYVGAEDVEDDDEPFEEKMPRLAAALRERFTKRAELEKQVNANLEGMGYGG